MNYVRENYYQIEYEYLNPGSLSDDERRIFKNFFRLSDEERKMMILYAELKSLRMVGEVLNMSRQTALNRIKEIRRKLI